MLTRLVIHDVVLIDKLVVDLKPGLNVFTGETGAGKSILLDALGLALGERSDAGLVRAGAAQASVTAEFSLPKKHAVYALAYEHGVSVDDPLILRRVIGKDGKSRAFMQDQAISIGFLKQIGELLLEIHGQFETHGLLNAATHRGLVDSFGGLSGVGQKVSATFRAWKNFEDRRREAEATRARAEAEEEFLRAAVAELNELAPEVGEADKLAERRMGLQHREKIVGALQHAEQALNEEVGASAALARAGKAVARVADKAAGLQELLAAIDRASQETAEAAAQVERYLFGVDGEQDPLQTIEERLFALRAVARKHNVMVDALPDLQKDLASRLDLLTDKGDQIAVLRKQVAEARNSYRKLGEELGLKRRAAAVRLEKALAKELPPLKLERAKFVVDVVTLPEEQWSAEGMERVSFQATTNPGSVPGALQKIASGGELARFMLALKVVLTASDPVPTLVFDEVDSGIGGATASAVGERLAQLAKKVQILVVTHSPQVASRGATHLRVLKRVKGKLAATLVELLDDGERREEIARMLAGTKVTDPARKAAESLLKHAG
jgi:DNA repair protein RecN (Recombination protein N)